MEEAEQHSIASAQEFKNSILPQWEQLGCSRWDIVLSWEGANSTKIKTKKTKMNKVFFLLSYTVCSTTHQTTRRTTMGEKRKKEKK